MADYKFLGTEPEFKSLDVELTNIKLVRIYSWYNSLRDTDHAKSYITDYCKKNNIKISISKHNINTYAWLARILTRGAKVAPELIDRLHKYLSTLAPDKITKEVDQPRVVRAVNRLDEWLPELEQAVDNFEEAFDGYAFFSQQSIPQTYVTQITEYYQPLLMELHEAYQKKDKDLIEAYSCYSRPQLKKMGLLVKSIIDDGNRYVDNVKKERKPRKKRTKSVESQLKYFKYMKDSLDLKLKSEDPTKIIGSSAVYVLNTKTNIMSMFVAKDAEGLSVSRTSISNYDEKSSKSKRVGRRLAEALKLTLEGTKASRKRALDKIPTAYASNFVDRINEHTIILKVDK